VSKSSRRRQRPGTQPSANRAGAQPPVSRPSAATPGGSSATSSARPSSSSAGGSPAAAGAGAAGAAASAAAAGTAAGTRTVGASTRPSSTGARRHGRRERPRVTYQRETFLERHRAALIIGGALIGVALLAAFVFVSAAQPTYACSSQFNPSPTPPPGPGQTPNLGYPQPDMGHVHVGVGDKVTYTYCAPASGPHINKPGTAGPIPARVYGPADSVIPQNWIHNLEHGGLVVVYRGDSAGATPDGQAAFKSWQSNFPPVELCGPVVARFDQMSTPFQAMVWGRVLLMDKWDPDLVNGFWKQWGGRTNLEPLCPTPNSSAAPSGSVAPSGSPVPSASPAASDTAVPSVAPNPSASPS